MHTNQFILIRVHSCPFVAKPLWLFARFAPAHRTHIIESMSDRLQLLCEQGQEQLSRMQYLDAQATLERAEAEAIAADDLDTLARLYMPLQETRRQIRQRCGEGIVKLDLFAKNPAETLDPEQIVAAYPHGQLLIAGFGSIEPALRVRELARQRKHYLETFLAAVFPAGGSFAVAIVPLPDVALPTADARPVDDLIRKLPPHSLIFAENELPKGEQRGDWKTFARVMDLWERLHAPFLAAVDMQREPRQKIEGYRKTLRVDNACELAHQKLSRTAHDLVRDRKAQ